MSSFSWLRNVPRYGFAKVGSTMASSEDVWVPVFCYFEQSCYEYSCTFFFFFSSARTYVSVALGRLPGTALLGGVAAPRLPFRVPGRRCRFSPPPAACEPSGVPTSSPRRPRSRFSVSAALMGVEQELAVI